MTTPPAPPNCTLCFGFALNDGVVPVSSVASLQDLNYTIADGIPIRQDHLLIPYDQRVLDRVYAWLNQ